VSASKPKSKLELARDDVVELLAKARETGKRADLCGARLFDLDLSFLDLSDAALDDSRIYRVDLTHATLASVKLVNADLREVDLRWSRLSASLVDANLFDVNLSGIDLTNTDLLYAKLNDVRMAGATVSGSRFSSTAIGGVDLSEVQGLDDVFHGGPCVISTSTLELTSSNLAKQSEHQQNAVFTFLRKAGVHEDLIATRRLWTNSPIEFYSCFISYSHTDREFAHLLYDTLQGRGIRCWLDEHQLLPGDNIYDMVDRGIRLWDKVLLCCSEASLTSWWVDDELGKAYEKERQLQR
jgi:hypothetical protein